VPGQIREGLRSGTGVRPAARVRMTVWVTSGRVSSWPRAAAAAKAALTPGITRQGMFSLSRISKLLLDGPEQGGVAGVNPSHPPAGPVPPP